MLKKKKFFFSLSFLLSLTAFLIFYVSDGVLFGLSSLSILSYKQLAFLAICFVLTCISMFFLVKIIYFSYNVTLLDYFSAIAMIVFTAIVYYIYIQWTSFLLLSHLYVINYNEIASIGLDFTGFWQSLMDAKDLGISKADMHGHMAATIEKNGKIYACLDVNRGIEVSSKGPVEETALKMAKIVKRVPDIACSELSDLIRGMQEAKKK